MTRFVHFHQVRGDHYDETTGNYGEKTIPTSINVDTISRFYPRNDNKPGTRITFADGGGFAVVESFDQVLVAVGADHAMRETASVLQLEDQATG